MSSLRERAAEAYRPELARLNDELRSRMLDLFGVGVEPVNAVVLVDGLQFSLSVYGDLNVAVICTRCGGDRGHLGGNITSLRELGRQLSREDAFCWDCETAARRDSSRGPYRCPICSGTGGVPVVFYGSGSGGNTDVPDCCGTCGGLGVLWAPEVVVSS